MSTSETSPKARRESLETKIEHDHDWQDGPVRQWEACGVTGTDTCTICGLQRTYYRGGQNSGDLADTYADDHGNALTLLAAANRGCA